MCTQLLLSHSHVKSRDQQHHFHPLTNTHTSVVFTKLSMGEVSMATNHSTETTAKLLEPNHSETDALWELCVEVCNICLSSCLVVCYRKKKVVPMSLQR